MAKIKCVNIACKYNDAILTKNKYGNYDSDVDMGVCNCEDDIELVSHECGECGYEEEGIDCNNFVFKDGIND